MRFIKFGIVGISNTLIHLAVYYVLSVLGVHYLIANGIAFIISVYNAWYWNQKYVFEHDGRENAKKIFKVYVVYAFSFFISMASMFLMVEVISISELIAPVLNLFITVPLNFCLNKFWVFSAGKERN